MQDIKIERYNTPNASWGGNIQPEDRSWIIFLDPNGCPSMYWSERDDSGAVIGGGIELTAGEAHACGVGHIAQLVEE